MRCGLVFFISPIVSDGIVVFRISNVQGLLDSCSKDFLIVFSKGNDCVVVNLYGLASIITLIDQIALFDFISEDDQIGSTIQLKHCQQLTVGAVVAFDGPVHTGAKHLFEVVPGNPARGNIVAIGRGPQLRIKGEGHLGDMNQVVLILILKNQ